MKRIIVFISMIIISTVISGCGMHLIKTRLQPPHKVEGGILFQYENKAAHSINLAGNFNGWCGTKEYDRFDPSIGVMHDEDHDGIWEIVLPLPAGRYQYKFAIDNGTSWVEDPNNPLKDYEDGIENSLIIIDD